MHASNEYQRVYVWEQPVRWFHWINAFCIVVLATTGYLIAHPPALLNANEATFGYWFGTLRFVHFLSGYVFFANFMFRLYWSLVGNKYANWRNFFPLTLAQIRQIWEVLTVDILQARNKPVRTMGHNSVAYFTYTGTGLLTLFQVASGFALLAPMSDSFFTQLFAWMLPLFGSEQNLRIFHYAVTWAFGIFALIHVYLVMYHDYVEGHGVLTSIIGGWKFMAKHQVEAPHASGVSGFPGKAAAPSGERGSAEDAKGEPVI